MPYNVVADGSHTKKLCSRLSSEVQFLMENGRLRFEPHGRSLSGAGGMAKPPMKPRTFRHSSMESIAIITCSIVDEHLTIKVICC